MPHLHPLIPPLPHCHHHYQFTTDRNATRSISYLLFCLLFMPLAARHSPKHIYVSVSLRAAEKFPLFFHPNFTQPFCIQTDSSKRGLGVELFQVENGERRTIAFASCVFNVAEHNYSITELELLFIIFAGQKFRVYLLGHKITVFTDHQALVFLYWCRFRNA